MGNKLTDRQSRIRNLLTDFSASELNKFTEFKDMWRACADFGLLSYMMPKCAGGQALSWTDILKTSMFMGEAFSDNGLIFAINNSLIVYAYILPKFYYDCNLKYDLCSQFMTGDSVASFAITEPQSGSDIYNMRTNVVINGDQIILNGLKTYISNATISNTFVVIAKNGNGSFTAILVRKGDEGFKVSREIKKMGLGGCPMGEVYFDNCLLPIDRIIGKAN